jgi:spermidine synthase
VKSAGLGQRVLVLAAAALAGAAGLGLESVLIATSGLTLGFARASALGIGAFVAGWAIGAYFAGRQRGAPGRGLIGAGLLTFVFALVLPELLLGLAARPIGTTTAALVALAAVFVCGLPQGAFLPWLARGLSRPGSAAGGVSALFAANLAGSVGGALVLGYQVVGSHGRPRAALFAGALALAAGLIGALALRGSECPSSASDCTDPAGSTAPVPATRFAGFVLGVATLWVLGLEWITLRLGVLWIGSQQLTLVSVLAAGLVALALGAALVPLLVHRDERGVLEVLALQLVLSCWPLVAAPTMRRLIAADASGPLLALALVGPTLVALGGLVPVLHRSLPGESGRRLGGLLVHESWGALAAGPLVHWLLVPQLGLGGAIAALSALGGLAALAVQRARPRGALLVAGLALVVTAAAVRAPEPALSTPKLDDPALTVLSFAEDSEFAVTVVDDGLLGERTLLTDRFRAAGTGREYKYMRVLGHLPLLLHPEPRRVAVLALGTGTTVGAVSLHPEVGTIDVLEISPAVVDQAHWFRDVNRGALEAPHVNVRVGDGRRSLAESPGRYDVITIEPLLPDSPFGVYLYTDGFYDVARRALAPGGLVCQWVPPHALEPLVFDAVVEAFTRSFEASSVWLFGAQVILLGGAEHPEFDPLLFPGADGAIGAPELPEELDALGLESVAGLSARRVADGARWPAAPRPLTDADPWITFRAKPEGLPVLGWLPLNLERVLDLGEEPVGARAGSVRALARARVVHARAERDLRTGARAPGELRAAVDQALRPALQDADAEVADFVRDVRFLRAIRDGVSRLAQSDPRAASAALIDAADLAPERADVHLYLALALQQLEVGEGARAALERARELCPRILETPAGARALSLGLRTGG